MRKSSVVFGVLLSEESTNHPSAVEAAVVDHERRIMGKGLGEMVRPVLGIENLSHSSSSLTIQRLATEIFVATSL